MRVLGLVTARGGSKGVPRKNLLELAGRPLLAYTAEAALASRWIDRVVLTTDDVDVAAVAKGLGIEVPFRRPDELAADDTPSLPVVQHACEWLECNDGWAADAIVVLQPTSPLRRAEHIDGAVDLLEQRGVDTVVSVVSVPHRNLPESLMRLEGDRLVHLHRSPDGGRFRRQDKPVLYARNGPAVLVTRRAVLDAGSLYGDAIAGLVMSEEDSIDIDTPFDVRVAELLLSHH